MLILIYYIVFCDYKDFVFKGGTRDYIVINKQGCTSCSSKKRGYPFYISFFSIGNIIIIQRILILMKSDPAPFSANFFLAHREVNWVKAQRKSGAINVWKIYSFFWFIDDLVLLNDDTIFEKQHKDIYLKEL